MKNRLEVAWLSESLKKKWKSRSDGLKIELKLKLLNKIDSTFVTSVYFVNNII